MAKAFPSQERSPTSVGEDEIASAGDAMLMIIPRAMWETLIRQGRAEGTGPAQVLDKALRAYLETNGSQETIEYLHRVANGGRRV